MVLLYAFKINKYTGFCELFVFFTDDRSATAVFVKIDKKLRLLLKTFCLTFCQMCAIMYIVKERKRGKEKNDSNRIELERNGKEFTKC